MPSSLEFCANGALGLHSNRDRGEEKFPPNLTAPEISTCAHQRTAVGYSRRGDAITILSQTLLRRVRHLRSSERGGAYLLRPLRAATSRPGERGHCHERWQTISRTQGD